MNELVLIGLGAALLACIHKRTGGIGKVARRNIFAEIEYLQGYGVPLHGDWDAVDKTDQDIVVKTMLMSGYKKLTRDNTKWRELHELYAPVYYKQLCRQYLKLVNPAIGKINYPHTTHTIKNSRGDVVVTYNNYDPDRDMQDALEWGEGETSNDPYLRTIYAIAAGNKFVWKGKRKGGELITRGLADTLFYSRTGLEGERRAYKGIIDNKNGWTVDKFVEQYLHDMPGAADGMQQALREFPKPSDARNYILSMYYKTFETPDYETIQDLPF